MLRIDRYLLREMLMPLLVGLATFVVMITGHMLFTVVDKIVEHGVGMPSVLKFVALQVPFAALLSLPASSLLASSLALNRMASENELTALRAGGAGFRRILRPVLLVGLVASLAALLLAGTVVPWASHQAETMLERMVAQRPTLAFRPGKFTNTETDLDFFAERVDQAQGLLEDLFVFQRRGKDQPLLFHADRARFTERGLTTGPATFYTLSPGGVRDWGELESLRVNLGSFEFMPGLLAKNVSDMSFRELQAAYQQNESASPGAGRRYAVELHWRISLAFSCLAFVLLALPITLSFARGQSLLGVLATLLLVFVYYVVMLWLRMVSENGPLPPVVGAWLENAVIFMAAGVGLWRQR
jgi:LPS export ABC transporter permease LptF